MQGGTDFLSKEKLDDEYFGDFVKVSHAENTKKELEKVSAFAREKVVSIQKKSDTTGLFEPQEVVKQQGK